MLMLNSHINSSVPLSSSSFFLNEIALLKRKLHEETGRRRRAEQQIVELEIELDILRQENEKLKSLPFLNSFASVHSDTESKREIPTPRTRDRLRQSVEELLNRAKTNGELNELILLCDSANSSPICTQRILAPTKVNEATLQPPKPGTPSTPQKVPRLDLSPTMEQRKRERPRRANKALILQLPTEGEWVGDCESKRALFETRERERSQTDIVSARRCSSPAATLLKKDLSRENEGSVLVHGLRQRCKSDSTLFKFSWELSAGPPPQLQLSTRDLQPLISPTSSGVSLAQSFSFSPASIGSPRLACRTPRRFQLEEAYTETISNSRIDLSALSLSELVKYLVQGNTGNDFDLLTC